MRRFGWLVSFALAATLAACAPGTDDMNGDATTPVGTPEMGADAFTLQLLHFADVDGGRDIVGNVTRFSALVEGFRSEMPESTLTLSSGDNWIPGPEYSVAEDEALSEVLGTAGAGRAHVAWLNALGVQASALGNHEMDLGPGAVAALLAPGVSEEGEEPDTWSGATFPYLSTNLDFSTDEEIGGIVGTDGAPASELAGQVAGYTTFGLNGETVGVIGATTPSLASIASTGDITILPEDASDIPALAALIQADIDALSAQGVDKIILLAHMQSLGIERELATLLNGVDIIVGGGSNTILADENDRLRDGDSADDTYPVTFDSAAGEPVLLVNTDGDYNYLGRLVVTFDEAGVIQTEALDADTNGVYAADEQGLADSGATAIPEVEAIANALGGALGARAGNVLGYTNVYLNGARNSVRTEETNFGNLSADANLAYAQSVEPSTAISIKNGGGIRGAIGACVVPPGSTDAADAVCSAPTGIPGVSEAGSISQLDLEIALRFNNGLSLVTVTGEDLKALMENGVSAVENVGGPFPQLAGMTLSFDATQPVGSRVVGLEVLDANGAEEGGERVTVVENGELTAAATQTFRVVTLGFLAEGGDDFPFPTGEAANVVDLVQEGTQTGTFTFTDDGTEQDALAEYLAADYADAGSAFDIADTAATEDTRIINIGMQ